MNLKRRGTRWALYRSRWIPRDEGVPHGYSIQDYVGSISADSEHLPEMLKGRLTASELLTVERRVCATARAARVVREAEATRLSKDPNWRLAKAAELVSEAAALSQAKCVPASHVRAIQLSLAEVQLQGAERASSLAGQVDVMRGALAAITSAAKAIRDGALGNAPPTGARTTRTYSLWSQIADAVEGAGDESLLSALQSRGFVKRKRR